LKVQTNTGHTVEGGERMGKWVESEVESAMGELAEHITRVVVHVSDENAAKGGDHDKRCVMEARFEGHQPVAVTHEADSVDQAVEGAATRLRTALDHTLGRLRSH